MPRSTVRIALGFLLAGSAGCTTALKQGYYAVRGADGEFYEIEIVDPDVLVTYRSIEIEPFTSALGQHVPPEVIEEMAKGVSLQVVESYLFYPEGKKILVTSSIIHYTGESGIEGAVGSVLGGEVCVCRVQLLDGESREMIGEAVCWGETKSAVRRGSGELGKGVGKGLVKWFEERLPEEEVEARQAELTPTNEEAQKTEEPAPDESEADEGTPVNVTDDASEDAVETAPSDTTKTAPAE